jgi:hypothetical protein
MQPRHPTPLQLHANACCCPHPKALPHQLLLLLLLLLRPPLLAPATASLLQQMVRAVAELQGKLGPLACYL